jgi:hypothetical protein
LLCNQKSPKTKGNSIKTTVFARELDWLPDKDLNLDKQIQSLLCYHYTIGQMVEQYLIKNASTIPDAGIGFKPKSGPIS